MTIEQLKELIQDLPDDMLVKINSGYHLFDPDVEVKDLVSGRKALVVSA